MYETMVSWETAPSLAAQSDLMRDFSQIWQAADKVVYSTKQETVPTARTSIERDFDADSVRQLKASAGSDVTAGGPGLAAHAFRDGLVDECQLFIAPVVVGGGKPWFPGGVRLELELLDERRFGNGKVHLRYRTKGSETAPRREVSHRRGGPTG